MNIVLQQPFSRIHPGINLKYALHPLSEDEIVTCNAMLTSEADDGRSKLMLMPTHHISIGGDMSGFKFECSAQGAGEVIPTTTNMFFGHTAVECSPGFDITKFLAGDQNALKETIREFMKEVKIKGDACPATLRCIPDNAQLNTANRVVYATDVQSMDCRPWHPEIPESIGLYHAYVRGYNRDVRTHKLFIVCSGGCAKAADEFRNILIDTCRQRPAEDEEAITAAYVAESEEAFWLRSASQRARCRLIKMLADKLKIEVPFMYDVKSYDDSVTLAVPTIDTIEHGITLNTDRQTVMVYNYAVDTTRITNGILCKMHPSEGYWIFKGAQRGNQGVYGAMFGNHDVCGSFPTRLPMIRPESASVTNSIPARCDEGIDCIVRCDPKFETDPPQSDGVQRASDGNHEPSKVPKESPFKIISRYFMCIDEAFFNILGAMQWKRDDGVVELIPIVVGICDRFM